MSKSIIKEYFAFSRRERIGIYTLLILIVSVTTIPYFFPLIVKDKEYDTSEFEKEIASLRIEKEDSSSDNYVQQDYKKYARKNYDEKNYESFSFDPNTASVDEWERLGVRRKTAESIQKYLSKGGKFRKAEDISKIWGLNPIQIARLIPLVNIREQPPSEKQTYPPYEKKKSFENIPVAIDIADSNALIALPGIGNKLAKRILNFRNRLGGFISVQQVGETFGLPDSTFQKIKGRLILKSSEVRKININSATLEELKAHPYIRYHLANVIVNYRLQHGNYSTVEDLKKIVLMTDSIYKKIIPYLSVQ